ncbi:IS3 family transposase, partial [Dickeya dianthicola]|uniref:IS3 family transposase n=1 Tax=Dickeya dianthicola TaxID=204039 RepID=UPI001F61E7B3
MNKPVDENRLALRRHVTRIFHDSKGSAGSRSIVAMLRQKNLAVGRFKVRRLMKEAQLQSKQPGSHKYKTATTE